MTISTVTDPADTPQLRTRYSSHVWNVIVRDPLALTSSIIIVLFLLIAIFAPLLAPYPDQDMGRSNPSTLTLPPSREHPFGTGHLGRDVLSRVIMGSRPALVVPLAISPQGEIVSKYRKMFPWLPIEAGTEAGTEFCVFDVPGIGRFGLSICYNSWFPETVRTPAWMGADVIIHPTMTPTSDRQMELVLNQANAIFNQCYFVDINGVGPWGGGRSMIVDPDGRVLQKAGERETILTEIIDLDNVKKSREFGSLGLCQLWKQLKDRPSPFPIYQNGIGSGKIYEDLEELKFHRNLVVE